MSDYETDVVLWSERQADLLRRRANGQLVNEAELDWENIAEEIESVGSEQRYQVEPLLLQAMLHLLQARAWPRARDVALWQGEVAVFVDDAQARLVPSMRQRIDIPRLYARPRKRLPEAMDGQPAVISAPAECPWSLDELLDMA